AMYRAVTVAAARRGVEPSDAERVAQVAREVDIDLVDGRVSVDGVDATEAIRSPATTAAVSAVAANSGVRTELRARQREWAVARGGGVIEGRDIGSVVFPDADLKLFLTASPRTRAERRVAEAGGNVDEIEQAIARRDHLDSTRDDSPLTEASGSVVVDTTGLGIDEVLERILRLIGER
ncbi:MAG: (d)CMP kinase, partial [Ilumatobacteraceae bacterium]